MAISAGNGWFLLNASPTLLTQLARTEALRPRALRDSPIRGLVLTNGDLDHCLGLFSLREWQPLAVYATERVWEGLEQNAMLATLRRFPGQLIRRNLPPGEPIELLDAEDHSTGIRLEAFPVAGKPPLHLATSMAPHIADNVGLELVAPHGKRAIYLSSAATLDGETERLSRAEILLLDGTFWSEEEPLAFGAPHGARAMGHLPISGSDGSLARLASLPCPVRLFTHVNNTNPVLDARSPARRELLHAGWDVARDGLQLVL